MRPQTVSTDRPQPELEPGPLLAHHQLMNSAEPQLHIEHHEAPEGGDADRTIVFTHGWLDDSATWSGVVAALHTTGLDAIGAERPAPLRSLTWDLRGHGQSAAPPPGEYTRDHSMGDLKRVVDQAGPPVVLAGHSLGGYLSLAHALRHPEDVDALVLVAAGPGFRREEARLQWNESVDVAAAKANVPPGSEEISKHVDSWVIDHLADIAVPALVIVGEYDKRFAASAAVFEKYLDVRASVVIPDAGHGVHRKQGAAVAAAITDFLNGLG